MTLQKGGADPIVLYADKNLFGLRELSARLEKDERLIGTVCCLSKPEELVEFGLQAKRILFLDGSCLHHRDRLEKLLHPQAREASQAFCCIERKELLSHLKSLDVCGSSWYAALLKQAKPEDLKAEKDPACVRALFAEDPGLRIAAESDFKKCEKELILNSRLANDSFMDRWITRSISRRLTEKWVHTDLTPNQITMISLVVGLVSAACFAVGEYAFSLAGAVLLLISAWIDCTDGEIARIKFMESDFGKKLDILSDNVVHWTLFFCIGLGLYRASGNRVYIVLGGFAVVGSLAAFFLLWKDIMQDKENAARHLGEPARTQSLVEKIANRDFTYLVFLMACIGKMEIFLGLTALGANGMAAYLLFNRLKQTPVATRET